MLGLLVVLGSSVALFGSGAIALVRFERRVSRSTVGNSAVRPRPRRTIPSHSGGAHYGYFYDL